MGTKIKFRGTPVCRAQGDSKIYESSHKQRRLALQENHNRFFSNSDDNVVVHKSTTTKYYVTFFGIAKEVSKEVFDTYRKTFDKGYFTQTV